MKLRNALVATSLVALTSTPATYAAESESKRGGDGPIKISKCRIIKKPGSYVVTQNLTAEGDCIIIKADHVTLDLGGFVLSGDDTGAGVGGGDVPNNVVVRNGTVQDFDKGIDLFRSIAIVEGINARRNGEDIRVGFGRVSGNFSSSFFEGPAIRIQGGIVRDNRVNAGIITKFDSIVKDNNAGDGRSTAIVAGEGNIVSGNDAGRTDSSGMFVGFGSVVSDNSANSNFSFGIQANCPSVIVDNVAILNGFSLDFEDEPLNPANFKFNGDGCIDVLNIGAFVAP